MRRTNFEQGGNNNFESGPNPVDRAYELVQRYPEMSWMVAADTHATPESSVAGNGSTVGAALFPDAEKASLSEFDRAYVGIAAMDWVRRGDYESLTACQPPAAKLSREGFDWLHQHTNQILPNEAAVRAMETFIAINDLGKIGPFAEQVKKMPGAPDTVDHDVVMHYGLQNDPSLSPSYSRLDSRYQRYVLDGMASQFNMGQLMQAEGVAASLGGLTRVSQNAKDFYLLHTLYDLAGAAGQFIQNGSVTLTESTVRNYKYVLEAIDGVGQGKSVESAYYQYLDQKAAEFDMVLQTASDVSVVRLATMLRMSSPEQAAKVRNVYAGLAPNTRAILDSELVRSGVNDGIASLIYYAPALLANLQKNAGNDSRQWRDNMALGMTTLARVYQAGRTRDVVRKSQGSGVQTILISELAQAAAQDPQRLPTSNIALHGNGLDVTAELRPVSRINLNEFQWLSSLRDLPGQRIAVVGMGGGSDGIQAAILAQLLADAGKEYPAVVSVRTTKPQSQSPDGKVATRRTLLNHGGEVAPGVFRITPSTQGSGRFLEHLPAGEVAMYQINDDEQTPITNQLQSLLRQVGGVDTVIGLDTGGDVLYPDMTGGLDAANSTPDQDLRSLNAIGALSGTMTKLCCVVAPGIDSPDNAGQILQSRGAVYFEPDARQISHILRTYQRWHMDGSDDRYFGKTPLAWQAVLAASNPDGVLAVNLPTSVVTSRSNPWNPYVMAQPAMRGMFFMGLDRL